MAGDAGWRLGQGYVDWTLYMTSDATPDIENLGTAIEVLIADEAPGDVKRRVQLLRPGPVNGKLQAKPTQKWFDGLVKIMQDIAPLGTRFGPRPASADDVRDFFRDDKELDGIDLDSLFAMIEDATKTEPLYVDWGFWRDG